MQPTSSAGSSDSPFFLPDPAAPVPLPADLGSPVLPAAPPGETPASNTGRKFPCPGCGAKLDFQPGDRALKCEFCGFTQKIDESETAVIERDWEEYWATAESHGKTLAGRSSEVQCRACAAVVLLEDKVVTDRCPYCGNDLENKPVAAHDMILPEGILPFKVDARMAANSFKKWVEGLWFAPSRLKHVAELGNFAGVYVPWWTYDSQTTTDYRGERGDNYQEFVTVMVNETYFESDGRGGQVARTRTVPRTQAVMRVRWSSVSGRVEHFFDDVLVCGSHSVPLELIKEVGPWDLRSLEPFHPQFLAGFQTERYTVDLKEGFQQARSVMDERIRALCCRDIGGDHQRLHGVNTEYNAVTFKHILQPLWLAPYRFHGQTFRLLINGRTGKVAGTRPYSFWKIFLFVLMIIALIASFVGAFLAFSGNVRFSQHTVPDTAVRVAANHVAVIPEFPGGQTPRPLSQSAKRTKVLSSWSARRYSAGFPLCLS